MSGTASSTLPPSEPTAAAREPGGSDHANAAPPGTASEVGAAQGGESIAAAPSRAGPVDVAIIANTSTPYRTHVHRRIAREMPEVRLWTVFTHELGTSPWVAEPPAEIRPVSFGPGEDAVQQDRPSRALHEWRKGGRVIRWLVEHNVRAVVLLGYNDAGRLRIIRWCARNGVACLMWADSNIHGDLARGARRWIKQTLLPHVLSRCCAVLPCGRLGRDYFKKYGVDERRAFFSPVEPDYELIRTLPPERVEQAAARFDLRPGRRRIVFSGRLIQDKRPDIAIDALAAISEERPEWDLVLVGDGTLRAALEARVPPRLASRVKFTGFLTDPADVSAIYRLCDVLILPSDYEPWALVINEAAASGLAIVSSSVVGASYELVRDGVNGFVFPPGDLAAATAALRSATDPQRVESLKAGSRIVLEDWRREGDPVHGLRAALRHCGVL
jgi:glycosyltransferase involved in cell wall biosynthesis